MKEKRLDFSKLTNEIFDIILAEIITEKGSDLLQNSRIHNFLSEELKYEVLEKWEKKQAHLIHSAELLNEWEKMEAEKLFTDEEEIEKKEEKESNRYLYN